MRTRHLLATASALVLGLAMSGARASAGDWSGPYIGFHAGASWANQALELGPESQLAQYFFNWSYLPRSIALDDESFAAGGLAGYNWQSGPLVFGIEADITGSRATARERS